MYLNQQSQLAKNNKLSKLGEKSKKKCLKEKQQIKNCQKYAKHYC